MTKTNLYLWESLSTYIQHVFLKKTTVYKANFMTFKFIHIPFQME